jgi:hypothetical protein
LTAVAKASVGDRVHATSSILAVLRDDTAE